MHFGNKFVVVDFWQNITVECRLNKFVDLYILPRPLLTAPPPPNVCWFGTKTFVYKLFISSIVHSGQNGVKTSFKETKNDFSVQHYFPTTYEGLCLRINGQIIRKRTEA